MSVTQEIGRSRLAAPALLALVTLWTLWKVGPDTSPMLDYLEYVARTWPTSEVTEAGAYILHSPLGLLVYRGLPFRGSGALAAEHAVAIGLAYAALGAWFCRELGARRGLMATSALVLAPVTAALLLWIGLYDAFTMLAWAAVLWTLRAPWPVRVAAGVLLGVQNPEQGLVGLVLLLLVRPLLPRAAAAPPPLAALAGCVVGKLAIDVYLAQAGAVSGSRLTYLVDWALLEPSLSSTARLLPLVVWSGLGGLWCFVGLIPGPLRWTSALGLRLGAAAAIWLAAAAVAHDHTRVLTLTAVPVVALGLAEVMQRFDSVADLLRSWRFWVLVLAPPTVVWLGTVLPLGWKGLP